MKPSSIRPEGSPSRDPTYNNRGMELVDTRVNSTVTMGSKIPSLADYKKTSTQYQATAAVMQKMVMDSTHGAQYPSDLSTNSMSLENRGTECKCGERKADVQNQYSRCETPDCQVIIHSCCINAKRRDYGEFECVKCTILNNDPLSEVKKLLIEPSYLISKRDYFFHLEFGKYDELSKLVCKDYDVEIRCIKLDGEHFFEQTWPDKCEIRFNGKLIKEYAPLQRNSAVKKRKDDKLRDLGKELKLGSNTVSIAYENVFDGKNSKIDCEAKYVFSVVLVRKLHPSELLQKISIQNRISKRDTIRMISEEFFENKDIKLSEVKIELMCKITFTYLENPARGKNCKHINCFSLNSFLNSMSTKNTRNWFCPLCRKPCYKIVFDEFMESLMQEPEIRKQNKQCVYLRNPEYNSDGMENSKIGYDFRKGGTLHFKEETLEASKKQTVQTTGKSASETINIDEDSEAVEEESMLGKRGQLPCEPQVIQDTEFLKLLYGFAWRKNYGLQGLEETDGPGFSAFKDKLQQRLESDLVAQTCFDRLYEMTMARKKERELAGSMMAVTRIPSAEGLGKLRISYLKPESVVDKGSLAGVQGGQTNLLETLLKAYKIESATGYPPFPGITI